MTVQARVNAALTTQTTDATLSALISFGGGLLLLTLAMAASSQARRRFSAAFAGVRNREFPWWLTIGGLAGAFYVFSQGQAVPLIGIALFSVAYVAAQTFGSFIWDHFGVGPSGPHPFSVSRVVGAGLAVVAVTVAVLASSGGVTAGSWLIVLPIVAGLGASWQQAANGRVRVFSRSVLATTFWNFLVGTTALAVVSVAQHVARPWPTGWSAEWWMLTGGPIGIVFIATAAVLVRSVGVLMMSLLITLGQLGTALAFSLWVPGNSAPSAGAYLGTAIAVLAVIVMLVPGRQRRAGAATSAGGPQSA